MSDSMRHSVSHTQAARAPTQSPVSPLDARAGEGHKELAAHR